MNQLVIFYLITGGISAMHMVVIALSLRYGTVLPFLPNKWLNSFFGIRNNKAASFQHYDPYTKKYMIKLSGITCVILVAPVLFIVLAIICDVPLPFVPDISDHLPTDTMIKLLVFMITTAIIHLVPMLLVVFALFYRIPLPFMPPQPVRRLPRRSEIIRMEQGSQDFASIHLTRYETFDRIFFYANCRNDVSGSSFKLVFCRVKEEDARTDCYLFDEETVTLERITLPPVNIYELEKMFSLQIE